MARSYSLLAAIVLIWGLYYLGADQLLRSGWDPEWMNALRFLIAGVSITLFLLARGKGPQILSIQKRLWREILVVSWIGVVLGMWALTMSQTMLPSSVVGALSATLPIWVTALAATRFFGSQRFGLRVWAAIFLGVLGVALIYSPWEGGYLDPLGVALAVAAAFFLSLEGLFFARWFRGEDALASTATINIWAGVGFTLGALFGTFEAGSWPLLLALALFSNALAYSLYFLLVALRGAPFANLYSLLVPPLALLAGVALVGEEFRILLALGCLLAVAGAFLAGRGMSQKE